MNIWHDIESSRITPEEFIAVVEISKGSKQKYEMDKKTGLLRLDRILYTSTHYPANYGFIPHTLAEDNDPLDVLILCSESLIPMSLVKCYPIGVIIMNDNGSVDERLSQSQKPTLTIIHIRAYTTCHNTFLMKCVTSLLFINNLNIKTQQLTLHQTEMKQLKS